MQAKGRDNMRAFVARSSRRVLVAGGLDPSGGAGLAADVEALLALGLRAYPVATALTVQGPGGALVSRPVAASFVRLQVEGLLGRGALLPSAVKVGMIGSGAIARALADALSVPELRALPLVYDPVLAATSGLPLLSTPRGRAPAQVLRPLIERATVVSPNRPELARLAGLAPEALARDDDAVEAARRMPCRAVLVKGGHRRGAPVDLLVQEDTVLAFPGRRRAGTARGTGCRLASAIAGLLATGAPLPDAVREAKRLVEAYLDAA